MNPCKDVSAAAIHKQLDGIAKQVTAELQKSHKLGQDKTSSGPPDCEKDVEESDISCTTSKLRRLDLPAEVVLDAINTVLYNRLHFSAPPMDHYYNLENSFIDKVS